MVSTTHARWGRPALLATTAILVAASFDAASAADADALQEVVVTARHISENLQDTPVAVSAFSADRLATAGAADLADLTAMVPSASLFAGRGSNSTLTAYVRGVGQQDPTWGSEPGVGLYVDDVYYARPQASMLDIYNVGEIEVLRGPQGTLYGKNTIGGAIKYVTSDLPDKPTADARVTYGSYDEHDFVGSFSAPIDDRFRLGGSIASFNRDGWGQDLTTGARIDNRDVLAGRLTIEFMPRDDISFRLNADDSEDHSNANPGHKEVAYGGFPLLSNVYDSYAGMPSHNYVMDRGVALTATWAADPHWTLKSITAYREGKTDTNIDFDGLPQPYLDVPAHYYDHQTSEEVQATYAGDHLKGVAGVYYMDSLAGGSADFSFQQLIALPLTEYLNGHILTNSWAGYFDGSYDIGERWTVSAGGRYSNDAKSGAVHNAYYLEITAPAFGGAAAPPYAVNTDYSNHKSWHDFTPRVSLSYKPAPDITTYVSYSEGFRSGGFDIRGNASLYPATKDGYRPETVDTYEAGMKGEYLDRRLRLNLDGFYSRYKDQQLTMSYPLPGALLQAVENAASSHIEGVELEAAAKLIPHLTATAVGAYTFAAFDQFNQIPFAGVRSLPTVSGFQYTPKWTGSIELAYDTILLDGALTAAGSIAYRSLTQIYDVPSGIDQPGYAVLDANVMWTAPSGRWTLALKGANLTDERYRVGGYYFLGAPYGNSVVGFYGAPRTVLSSIALHL
jgi:iron complex outermembrane receptor protein